jgi:hypothetical protein
MAVMRDGDDSTVCADCGRDVDREQTLPLVLGNTVMAICYRCRTVRRELESLIEG